MRTRNKLALSKLPEFISWANENGWVTINTNHQFEAWRGVQNGTTAIIHKRIENNSGTPLTHLTTWGESERLRKKWMADMRHKDKNGELAN